MPVPPLGALEMTVQASDGLLLKGILAYPEVPPGGGFPLAVLAHQYPATSDSYAPLIEDLLDLGIAALAFDERGHGSSTAGLRGPMVIDTPVGFTSEAFGTAFVESSEKMGFNRIDDDILRVASWGAAQNFVDAGRLFVIGASVGGTAATLVAPRIPGLTALVTLAPAGELVWGSDGREQGRKAMERVKAPALHLSSAGDPFGAAENARAWSDGFPRARAHIIPGSAHAMAIYFDVRDVVLDFLREAIP